MTKLENRLRLSAWKLAALAALASSAFALILVAYLHSTPNTAGVSFNGQFDGERAFADLRQIVAFGPRPPGSQALERCRAFIVAELHSAGVRVSDDAFTASTPIGPIPMTNIVATIPGTAPSVVIIGGHYDTKRMATPFVGANDGGSSAAFLIELARVLARGRHKVSYQVVFFDGEEALARWSGTDSLYGSRHFAKQLAESDARRRVKAVVVVDMIADSDLDIQPERSSTPWLTDRIFTQAKRLGYGRFFASRSRRIGDDHLAFLRLGIPAVDLIDFDYGPFNFFWHTRFDTVDKCSSASLAIVAHVVLTTLAAFDTNPPSKPRGASS